MATGADRLMDGLRPIVGVGMKMHLGHAESLAYLDALAAATPRLAAASVFVLPSFPLLVAAGERLAGTGIAFGAQDAHWEDRGAHTGSVSPTVLAELGCAVVELGHAERRRDFGEDDAMVARKAAAAARRGLVPVVCIGEPQPTAATVSIVRRQVDVVLGGLGDPSRPLVLAYEPTWAIGGDRPASVEHVSPVLAAVRTAVASRSGPTRLLYGGSVAPETAAAMLAAGADGLFASRSALTLPGLERLVAGVT